MQSKPKIYVYRVPQENRYLRTYRVIASDGTYLDTCLLPDDGHSSSSLLTCRTIYDKHYPKGYDLEFISEAEQETHEGLRRAVRLNEEGEMTKTEDIVYYTLKDAVRQFMASHGYEGLVNITTPMRECFCTIQDGLAPCGGPSADCILVYKWRCEDCIADPCMDNLGGRRRGFCLDYRSQKLKERE